MRLSAVVLLMLLLFGGGSASAEAWDPGGSVVINGKTVAGASFVKQGRHIQFPIVAIANAVGRKASFDGQAVVIDGQKATATSLVVVNGVPYVGWRDLSRLVPGLEYGMEPTRAVFAYGTVRTTMPTGSVQGGGGDSSAALMVINKNDPGQQLDIKPFIVSGKYTVFEFFSEF